MNKEKKDIKSLSFFEVEEEIKNLGEPKFRSKQVYEWLHVKLVDKFEKMTNISKSLQKALEDRYFITSIKEVERKVSSIDETNKFLFRLEDGNVIESVWMKYQHGNSVCISSQVGCRMGCKFCASTIGGLERNLTVAEMLDQIYQITKITEERVSNIVIMGTGEPLDNYDNFVKFIKMITDEHGLHISQRTITASTCGMIPQMRTLAKEKFQITLALSLHGSTQEKRENLMPVSNQYKLNEVLETCDFYFEETKRRITFEYSLVAGVNDTIADAEELIGILKRRNCHLNLIPVNPIKERDYKKPSKENAQKFKNKLEKNGINVTIRREMGADIDGACGQLRRCYIETP